MGERETLEKVVTVMGDELEETEEREVVKGWSDVTPGKTEKSPKIKDLEYGQVKIATRFSVLIDVDDKGNPVDQEKGNEGEATVVYEVAEGPEVNEGTEVTDTNGGEVNVDEGEANNTVETNVEATVEVNVDQLEERNTSEIGEKVTFVEKVKQGMRAEDSSASVGEKSLRPSLSRASKTNHKIFPKNSGKEALNPGTLGKRSRKSSQSQ